ncbi:MAG: ATP-binding protein, partial [Flexibacteraceae bacterium]
AEREFIKEKNATRKKGIMDVYELKTIKKDGSVAWMLISGAPILNTEQETVGSIGIHLDITDRKLLEEELKESKQIAEESAKAKEHFMATMSHEIRTPMNAIIGMQRLLAKTVLDTRQRRYIDAIGISASNLLTLLNDVLDFTKIQAGKVELSINPFQIRETIRNIRNMLEFKADEKGIRFDAELDPSLPEYVLGDNNRIYQVLINLAGNAIKFTEKGSVTLTVKSVGNNTIRFRVKDTGLGMDQATLNKVFEAFTQANSSISSRFGGTGLGLSISKELVEIMGGSISVESELGVGSVFSFDLQLPACDASQISLENTARTEARLDGSLILVVEDNDFNRLLAQTVLESAGASVSISVNGKDAIDSVAEHKPDLILMDLQMPVLNGIDAACELRKQGYDGAILALTANIFPEEREKCLNIGMNDLVVKPFDEVDLINKVAFWLASKPVEKEVNNLPLVTIDLTRLKKTSLNNAEFYLKMLELAKSQIDVAIREMTQFLEVGNFEALSQTAHRIKPTLDHLDANPCKTTIRKIELLKTNSADQVNAQSYLNDFCEEAVVLNKLIAKAISAV